MEITRRESLALALSMAVAGCGGDESAGSTVPPAPTPTPPPPAPTPPPSTVAKSLDQLARDKGMRFGSAVNALNGDYGSFRNTEYAKLLEAECSVLVAENEMKWGSVNPNGTGYNWTPFDDMLQYSESKNFAMRGHNILWHQPIFTPDWIKNYNYGANPATAAAKLIRDHTQVIADRYKGKIYSYDVVIEACSYEDSSVYSQTSLSNAFGGTEAMMDYTFNTAKELLPNTELLYEDYMS
jgi:endo-1,4-beta-xylanase